MSVARSPRAVHVPFDRLPRAAMVAQRSRWAARGAALYAVPSPILWEDSRARFYHHDLPDLYLAELRREQAQLLVRLGSDHSGEGEDWLRERLERVAAELARRRRVGTTVPPTPARPDRSAAAGAAGPHMTPPPPPRPIPSARRVTIVWRD